MSSMRIALALGGGGVKGLAHIGVIRALEKINICIEAIAGASMGAIVGVLYSLGYSIDEIEQIFQRLQKSGYLGHNRKVEPSFLGNRGLEESLRKVVGNCTFNDLKIPMIITATEIKHGREVFLRDGPLVDALLASSALPGIFPARRIGDMDLTDAGTINPVPVEAARSLVDVHTPVVAVVLTPPLGVPATMDPVAVPGHVPRWITERIKQIRFVRAVEVFFLSQDLLNRAITRHNLNLSKPDLIIAPEVAHLHSFERVYVTEIALKGDQAVRGSLPELLKLFPETLRTESSL